MSKPKVIIILGPTASGKTALSIQTAKELGGEIISVDSRQVFTMLDIGTEKVTAIEMEGVPHHLIDIRRPEESYSAGDFSNDANKLISEIHSRGNVPILAGGTNFYIDALLYGIPQTEPVNQKLRDELSAVDTEKLFSMLIHKDPARAETVDKHNKRRLIRALEILETQPRVAARPSESQFLSTYDVEWKVIEVPRDILRERIETRLKNTLAKGLVEEAQKVYDYLLATFALHYGGLTKEEITIMAQKKMKEFGLEYSVVLKHLLHPMTEEQLYTSLVSKLWQLAKRQKNWTKKILATARP